jgi:hypothetical protein
MPMVYDIHRLEGTSIAYHLFDTEAEAHQWAMENYYRWHGYGPWSEVMHREWNEGNLSQLNVHDHRKHSKKETK